MPHGEPIPRSKSRSCRPPGRAAASGPRRRAWPPIGTADPCVAASGEFGFAGGRAGRSGGSDRGRLRDVTEWDQVEALAATALDRFGRIDAVFASAGFGATRGFLEESPEHWRSLVLTNVLGPGADDPGDPPPPSCAGRQPLRDHQLGGGTPRPHRSLHSATKFAATAIGEALRQELRQMRENDKIKVTLIEPGITDTKFFDDKPAGWALRDEDIAREILHALTAPPGVELNEILIRPTAQRG